LSALLPVNPFSPEGPLGVHANMPVLKKSLENPAAVPDLAEFRAAREAYLRTFNKVMQQHKLDVLIFPQSSAEIPGTFEKTQYPATTVSEINVAGLPGVTVPAGQFKNGAPFSLIFVGPMWSEADLLAFAYDYEQATRHRIVPQLVEEPYPVPSAT
jgi:Asp-tRNA(Asn)/Glu-tRNA(Gln) amidotransferase A subunit family amidase